MNFSVLVGGDEYQIGFSVVEAVVVDVVNYFVVWTVCDLSVHKDLEGFTVRDLFSEAVVDSPGLSDIPTIAGDSVVIFLVIVDGMTEVEFESDAAGFRVIGVT